MDHVMNHVMPVFKPGPADVVLCDGHFSWGHQHKLSSSLSEGFDDISDDITCPWSLSNISLTVQPVSVCVFVE